MYGTLSFGMQVKEYTRSLFQEAKWLKEGYIPTLDEYMSNALISVAQALMIARSYVGRSDMVTEETFRWVATNPPIVKASCLIFRLMDDITTHEPPTMQNVNNRARGNASN
ncbi:hypothetical protein M8C21_029638 [Ambrosia artemisiifolia]|uniref:Terpene synthase metal-binding domain-containing protein n=1 Tax=Ambrosia artemisiifolia TaxID=4212 RepID=A0AAD5GXL0_AMBAR|nr:hypothetical protein M8C21_029638 [Ambrosia artemisiifolia]